MATTSPSLPESVPPHELRNQLRRTLRATLDYMDSDAFFLELEEMDDEERKQADLTRGETYRAWRRINNQQLDEFRTQLAENEAEILFSTQQLNESLTNFQNVATVINNTNQVLSLATRLMTIV